MRIKFLLLPTPNSKEENMESQIENVLQQMDRWSDRFYKLNLELLELEQEFSSIESELVAIQK